MAVFEELRPTLLSIPESIADSLQEILSAKRIGAFLLTRDLDRFEERIADSRVLDPQAPLYFKGTVGWTTALLVTSRTDSVTSVPAGDFQLRDIDLTFARGKVHLIAGKFGAGKTLMLLALMGEARLLEGRISYAVSKTMDPQQDLSEGWHLLGTGVAYVPQTPWLQSQSIRFVLLRRVLGD